MTIKTFPLIKLRLPVRIIKNEHSYPGLINLITEGHISMTAGYQFDVGETIKLECEMLPRQVMRAEGCVIKSVEKKIKNSISYLLDLRLDRVSEADRLVMYEYLGRKADRRAEARIDIVVPANLVRPTRLGGLSVLNGSKKSLFFTTDIPIPPKTFLRLMLQLPEQEIVVDGTVVHHLNLVRAQLIGRRAGVGLEILQIKGSEQIFWTHFLEEWKTRQSGKNKGRQGGEVISRRLGVAPVTISLSKSRISMLPCHPL